MVKMGSSVSEFVSYYRKSTGFSQAQLARVLDKNWSAQYISNIERGVQSGTLSTFVARFIDYLSTRGEKTKAVHLLEVWEEEWLSKGRAKLNGGLRKK